jgi:hypothetical protein
MKLGKLVITGSALLACTLSGSTLGFVEQRFADVYFEKDEWSRVAQPPCYTYTARADDATVEILGIGMTDLVPFRAKKGMTVTVCGEIAALEEGFEAGQPIPNAAPRMIPKR